MLAEGMEQYKDYHIAEMPLGTPFFRAQVERFLGDNALAFEEVDSYYVVTDGEVPSCPVPASRVTSSSVSPWLRSIAVRD